MKHKLVYFDLEEITEEYDTDSFVKISFFFSDVSLFSNEINIYKAYRLDNNEEVILKDYQHNLKIVGEESISFIMPDFDICIKPFKIDNNKLGFVNVDISNIKDILYKDVSYLTQAKFSDYYDLGFKNFSLNELKYNKLILGADIKVVLKLIEDKNIYISFNNKKYELSKKNVFQIDNRNIVEYIFENIEFIKEGTIKFEI